MLKTRHSRKSLTSAFYPRYVTFSEHTGNWVRVEGRRGRGEIFVTEKCCACDVLCKWRFIVTQHDAAANTQDASLYRMNGKLACGMEYRANTYVHS